MKSEKYHKNISKIAELRALAETRNLTEEEEVDLEIAIEQNEREDHPVRAVTVPTSGNVSGTRERSAYRGKKLGSFLQDVIVADSPGREVPQRLRQERSASGLSESVLSDGGFAIPQNYSDELLTEAFETGLLASRCRQMPIRSGSSLKIPGIDESSRATGSRWGGIQLYYASEASEATKSKPKFRMIELNPHKLIGICYLTSELMEDSASLESYVKQAFSEEFGFQMDDDIINGSGAGKPLGIMNSGAMISVEKESGQAADTIVYENILKMWSRLIANARADSTWLINQDCEPQLGQMSLAVGTGGAPVYLPAGGAATSPYGTLFGRPVLAIEQAAKVGDTGDIMLASFGRGYIVSQKGGMTSQTSLHVQFLYDEAVLKFRLRWDGQPVLSAPITPFSGGPTLSHFVKLDERA